jgi:hypothetical protein
MVDLFEDPEKLPAKLRAFLLAFNQSNQDYQDVLALLNSCEKIGYSFEFGLDSIPYNLHKIAT